MGCRGVDAVGGAGAAVHREAAAAGAATQLQPEAAYEQEKLTDVALTSGMIDTTEGMQQHHLLHHQHLHHHQPREALDQAKRDPSKTEKCKAAEAAAAEAAQRQRDECVNKRKTEENTMEVLKLCEEADKLTDARDYHPAEKCHLKALEILPHHAQTLCHYADMLHNGRRDIDKAEELFKKALQIEPQRLATLFNYAGLLRHGRMREARDMYARACELNPTKPWIQKYGHHFQDAEDVGWINGAFAASEPQLVQCKDVLNEVLHRDLWHAYENNLLSNITEGMQQGTTMARIGSLTVRRLGAIKVDDDRYSCLPSLPTSARPSPTSL